MVKLTVKGDYKKTEHFLKNAIKAKKNIPFILSKYGQQGVDALAAATPVDSGETAKSWGYEISCESGNEQIMFYNTNVNKFVNIAIILQYGHGTGTGGYVQGIDYINPALRPIFEKIAEDAWTEVTKG